LITSRQRCTGTIGQSDWLKWSRTSSCNGNPDHLHEDGTAIHCMIGGAPFLMGPLEAALLKDNRVPVYAFSVRESVEKAAG
jgi:hypothetical protein